MRKKKAFCTVAIGDCNPSDCNQPTEIKHSCDKWQRHYQKRIQEADSELPKIPKAKKKGQKAGRKDDLKLYKPLIELVETIANSSLLYELFSKKSYLLEKFGEEEKKSCAYLRKYYGVDPAIDAKAHVNNAVANAWVSGGIMYTQEERNFNERVVSTIDFLKSEYTQIVRALFNNRQAGEKAKQWYVDKMGLYAERYLPDWKKFKKRTLR